MTTEGLSDTQPEDYLAHDPRGGLIKEVRKTDYDTLIAARAAIASAYREELGITDDKLSLEQLFGLSTYARAKRAFGYEPEQEQSTATEL